MYINKDDGNEYVEWKIVVWQHLRAVLQKFFHSKSSNIQVAWAIVVIWWVNIFMIQLVVI